MSSKKKEKENKIDEEILQLLDVICSLITQYMPKRDEEGVRVYEHQNMSAGEGAVDVLIKYGLGYDDGYSIVPNIKFWGLEYLISGENQTMIDFLNKE
ncbi:MAG: hypothetical protein DRH26_03480 [Deltaproteobacteria bacterium]|nr:MAG: hypothetical protein DRH26_03480 [Deltaproteobacteria bacterium]